MRGVDDLDGSLKFFLVDAAVVPEVFTRVVQAKQLLAKGKAKSLSEAAEMVGISRSTLYKYKDSVFSYEGDMVRRIATIYAELEDRAGVLSSMLSVLSESGANILTINQNIPVDGVAPVSISMRTDSLDVGPDVLTQRLGTLDGIVNIRLLSN